MYFCGGKEQWRKGGDPEATSLWDRCRPAVKMETFPAAAGSKKVIESVQNIKGSTTRIFNSLHTRVHKCPRKYGKLSLKTVKNGRVAQQGILDRSVL